MKVSFSIQAVLSTLLSIALGAAVPIGAAKNLSKRQGICRNPGDCPGYVPGNYYQNVRLPLIFLYLSGVSSQLIPYRFAIQTRLVVVDASWKKSG
jgi:hypothetical protein